jgi:hypothetical protein
VNRLEQRSVNKISVFFHFLISLNLSQWQLNSPSILELFLLPVFELFLVDNEVDFECFMAFLIRRLRAGL